MTGMLVTSFLGTEERFGVEGAKRGLVRSGKEVKRGGRHQDVEG